MRDGTAASVLLLTALVLGVGRSAAAGPGPAAQAAGNRGPHRSKGFQEKVDRAIDRGVYWLLNQRKKDGRFGAHPGETPLVVYTLRACGLPADDDAVEEGLEILRRTYGPKGPGRGTYEVALALLALDAHYLGLDGELADEDLPITARDLVRIQYMVRVLEKAQSRGGGFTYNSPGNGTHYDNSNSQYGLLGLKAGARLGAKVKQKTWMNGLKHFLRDQMKAGTKVKRYEFRGVDEDGYGSSKRPSGATDKARGWGYTYGGRVTGSMTTGGISSLAICRSELLDNRSYDGALSRHVDQSIRDGVAWLGKEFSVTQNPGLPAWHYYYLYGLERAGVLSSIHLMERHDWYGDGAEFLVKAQQSDGGWMSQAQFGMQPPRGRGGKVSTIQETCFALLFLKRATFTVKAKGTPTESEDDDFDLSGAPDLDDASFQPVFDAVFLRFRQADVKRRRILATDFVRLGVRAIPLLLRCVDDDAPIVRKAAVAALRNVTGRSYGLPVGDKRSQVVANWEQWWVAIRGRVTADTAAGRFVVAEKPALKAPTSGD